MDAIYAKLPQNWFKLLDDESHHLITQHYALDWIEFLKVIYSERDLHLKALISDHDDISDDGETDDNGTKDINSVTWIPLDSSVNHIRSIGHKLILPDNITCKTTSIE